MGLTSFASLEVSTTTCPDGCHDNFRDLLASEEITVCRTLRVFSVVRDCSRDPITRTLVSLYLIFQYHLLTCVVVLTL